MLELFRQPNPSESALAFMLQAATELEMERDADLFLDKVLASSRTIVGACAGSLYLVEGDNLQFLVCQNDDLDITRFITLDRKNPHTIPRSNDSIAGFVANHGEILMIPDVYNIDSDSPFSFNESIDKRSGFCTKTILAVPLRHPKEGVIGVMELINHQLISLEHWSLGLIKHFGVLCASSIINMKMERSLEDAYLETIFRLGIASEYKDDDTYAHVQRIRYTSRIIAEEMGCSSEELHAIFHASAMHDLGKIGVPDAIINKPGKLDSSEWEVMQSHASMGTAILDGSRAPLLQTSAAIAGGHHERWDGNGYPNGVAGADIPLAARIVAVADVFDALVNQRAYKPAWPIEDAITLIQAESGSHFDPAVVDAFLRRIDDISAVQSSYQKGSVG
ncbi:MAG: HD domain-containing phosphohydrolase [Mariprofundales bacterium]|nr:HD domain-containing phosphohydrolase [Mariprofundales bacterium]